MHLSAAELAPEMGSETLIIDEVKGLPKRFNTCQVVESSGNDWNGRMLEGQVATKRGIIHSNQQSYMDYSTFKTTKPKKEKKNYCKKKREQKIKPKTGLHEVFQSECSMGSFGGFRSNSVVECMAV